MRIESASHSLRDTTAQVAFGADYCCTRTTNLALRSMANILPTGSIGSIGRNSSITSCSSRSGSLPFFSIHRCRAMFKTSRLSSGLSLMSLRAKGSCSSGVLGCTAGSVTAVGGVSISRGGSGWFGFSFGVETGGPGGTSGKTSTPDGSTGSVVPGESCTVGSASCVSVLAVGFSTGCCEGAGFCLTTRGRCSCVSASAKSSISMSPQPQLSAATPSNQNVFFRPMIPQVWCILSTPKDWFSQFEMPRILTEKLRIPS